MLTKKINKMILDKKTLEKIIENIFKHSFFDGEIRPFMYLPYILSLKIINKNFSINEYDISELLLNLPDKYYPYIDPIDREISILLKEGKTLIEAKEIANKKIIFSNSNFCLFLRTFPLILIDPINSLKNLENLTYQITFLTHNDEISKLMVYYNLINIEYLNGLTFIDHLRNYLSNQNLKLKYLFNSENNQLNGEITNEYVLYYLIDYSYYLLQDMDFSYKNNTTLNVILSLTFNLFKENLIVESSENIYNFNLNQEEKKLLKYIKKRIK
ncbi:MAG: hypothetical protein N3A58_03940 [Spirochaetes bacterium]|nr:hypothetical protein [Spirochaetota bacterium]